MGNKRPEGAAQILSQVINPALAELEHYKIPATDRARVMLLAICGQEAVFVHRRQLVGSPPRPTGPATGLWQFEQGGGVKGVMEHRASRKIAHTFAMSRVKSLDYRQIWQALEHDDFLAAIFGRLLLWTSPKALPQMEFSAEQSAWDEYIFGWRPGKPHRHTWGGHWRTAINTVLEQPQAEPPKVATADQGYVTRAEFEALQTDVDALRAEVAKLQTAGSRVVAGG